MPELITGQAIRLSPLVCRVLAPNPGLMTGPGTNSYLIGQDELVVLDPGPALEAHVNALEQAAADVGGRIRHIVLTHTHRDHSPAAALLAARTGARIYGRRPHAGDPAQDLTAGIHHELAHEEDFSWAGHRLKALHTPGHVGNHLCYWLEAERLLFTGDHLINGSTVVIVPPSGHMGDYLRSLQLLQAYAIDRLAPGHGDVIDNAQGLISYTIAHRLAREAKVLEKLAGLLAADLATLVVPVYDDVNPNLHPLAQYSLHAHLIKLRDEGRVQEQNGRWTISGA